MTDARDTTSPRHRVYCLEDRAATPEEAAERMPGYAPGRVRYIRNMDEAGNIYEFASISGRGNELLPDA